jgi:DNA invertase Pin-like site-specific DNA recombinase
MSSAAAAQLRAIGYVRVSTEEQGENGASLDAQKRAITEEAARRGWSVDLVPETISTRRRARPRFDRALEQLDAGEYSALIVARLDRAWRSLGHFAETLDRSDKHGWQLVLMDPPVDTQTPFGRAMAGVAAVFAELERALISQRTREGMAQKKLDGSWKNGRGPGRHRSVSEEAVRFVRRHAGQRSQQAIAEDLERLGIPAPTARGWSQQAVSRIVKRYVNPVVSAP